MSNKVASRRTSIPALGLLTWRPMAGYEVKTQIENSLANFWSESYGQLYPQLAALETSGMIEADPHSESDGRGKKVYKITPAGREHLANWLDEPPKNRPPRNELLMKVFFALEGELTSTITHVRDSRAAAEQDLKRYQSIEADLSERARTLPKARLWLMTVRNGLRLTRAHIEWCDDVIEELEEMKGNHDDTL